MSYNLIYKKGNFIVVLCGNKNKSYFTVINTNKHTHCHVSGLNKKAAIMICERAYKNYIPKNYPDWMKICIKRIL